MRSALVALAMAALALSACAAPREPTRWTWDGRTFYDSYRECRDAKRRAALVGAAGGAAVAAAAGGSAGEVAAAAGAGATAGTLIARTSRRC